LRSAPLLRRCYEVAIGKMDGAAFDLAPLVAGLLHVAPTNDVIEREPR